MELVRKEKLGNVEVYKTKIYISSLKGSLDSCIILKKEKHIKERQNNREQHKSDRICNHSNLNQTLENFKRFQELNFIKLWQKFKNNLTSVLYSDTVTLSDVHPIYSVNTKSERKFKPPDLYHLKRFLTISSYYLPIIL